MPGTLKKILIVAAFVGLCAGAVTFVTVRTNRTEIDSSVADVRERHTCPYCGNQFLLSVSQAVSMRRSNGGIVCPRCGKKGATKDDALASTDLVRPNTQIDQENDDENAGATTRRQAKRATPTGTLSREPFP